MALGLCLRHRLTLDVASAFPRVSGLFSSFCLAGPHSAFLLPPAFAHDAAVLEGAVPAFFGSEGSFPHLLGPFSNIFLLDQTAQFCNHAATFSDQYTYTSCDCDQSGPFCQWDAHPCEHTGSSGSSSKHPRNLESDDVSKGRMELACSFSFWLFSPDFCSTWIIF